MEGKLTDIPGTSENALHFKHCMMISVSLRRFGTTAGGGQKELASAALARRAASAVAEVALPAPPETAEAAPILDAPDVALLLGAGLALAAREGSKAPSSSGSRLTAPFLSIWLIGSERGESRLRKACARMAEP